MTIVKRISPPQVDHCGTPNANTMNALQKILLGNALFSFLSGLLLCVFPQLVADLFAVQDSLVFQLLGAGLLLFSASVFRESRRDSAMGALSIIIQDLIWVLGSIVLLLFRPIEISLFGNVTIAVVMLIVLSFALLQSNALAQANQGPEKGSKQMLFERIVQAPQAKVWEVVSDVAHYHHFAPNIDDVKVVSGQGQNMVRSCSHKGRSWSEVCTLWNEGREYAFEVNTDAPDYPYPISMLRGHWLVEPVSPKQTRIAMTFDFRYNRRIHNVILHPLFQKRFTKICKELMDNWEAELSKNPL